MSLYLIRCIAEKKLASSTCNKTHININIKLQSDKVSRWQIYSMPDYSQLLHKIIELRSGVYEMKKRNKYKNFKKIHF